MTARPDVACECDAPRCLRDGCQDKPTATNRPDSDRHGWAVREMRRSEQEWALVGRVRELEAVAEAARAFIATPADWTNSEAQKAYGELLLALRSLPRSAPRDAA